MPKLCLYFPKEFGDPVWASASFCVETPKNRQLREWVIGRHPAADITLAIRSVSIHHCSLNYSYAARQWSITDLGSTNGTRINGELLNPKDPRPVAIGDDLYIGPNLVKIVEKEQSTEKILGPATVASAVPIDHRTGKPLPPPPPPPPPTTPPPSPSPPPPPTTYADLLKLGLIWLLHADTRSGAFVRLVAAGVAAVVAVLIWD